MQASCPICASDLATLPQSVAAAAAAAAAADVALDRIRRCVCPAATVIMSVIGMSR